eukprot:2618894-Alexandrium_andersonii.AAC.1
MSGGEGGGAEAAARSGPIAGAVPPGLGLGAEGAPKASSESASRCGPTRLGPPSSSRAAPARHGSVSPTWKAP